MVAVGNVEHLRARNDLAERCGRARDFVRGADRDQHRHGDVGGFLARHQPARAAQAGRQRPAIAAGLVGEGAKRPPDRIGDVLERIRLQRLRDVFAGAAALDQADADAAEDRRAQPLRLRCARASAVIRAAQRIAHDVGALDLEMIHQRA